MHAAELKQETGLLPADLLFSVFCLRFRRSPSLRPARRRHLHRIRPSVAQGVEEEGLHGLAGDAAHGLRVPVQLLPVPGQEGVVVVDDVGLVVQKNPARLLQEGRVDDALEQGFPAAGLEVEAPLPADRGARHQAPAQAAPEEIPAAPQVDELRLPGADDPGGAHLLQEGGQGAVQGAGGDVPQAVQGQQGEEAVGGGAPVRGPGAGLPEEAGLLGDLAEAQGGHDDLPLPLLLHVLLGVGEGQGIRQHLLAGDAGHGGLQGAQVPDLPVPPGQQPLLRALRQRLPGQGFRLGGGGEIRLGIRVNGQGEGIDRPGVRLGSLPQEDINSRFGIRYQVAAGRKLNSPGLIRTSFLAKGAVAPKKVAGLAFTPVSSRDATQNAYLSAAMQLPAGQKSVRFHLQAKDTRGRTLAGLWMAIAVDGATVFTGQGNALHHRTVDVDFAPGAHQLEIFFSASYPDDALDILVEDAEGQPTPFPRA